MSPYLATALQWPVAAHCLEPVLCRLGMHEVGLSIHILRWNFIQGDISILFARIGWQWRWRLWPAKGTWSSTWDLNHSNTPLFQEEILDMPLFALDCLASKDKSKNWETSVWKWSWPQNTAGRMAGVIAETRTLYSPVSRISHKVDSRANLLSFTWVYVICLTNTGVESRKVSTGSWYGPILSFFVLDFNTRREDELSGVQEDKIPCRKLVD
jgi:hypothetical protein